MATHEPLLPALYERDREPALPADDGTDIEVSDDETIGEIAVRGRISSAASGSSRFVGIGDTPAADELIEHVAA